MTTTHPCSSLLAISRFVRTFSLCSERMVVGGIALLLLASSCMQAQTAHFAGVQSTLNTGSTFGAPNGIAVDASGDVFVLDTVTGHLSEIVAVNGRIPTSPTVQVLANNYVFSNSYSMTIDSSGNPFLPSGTNSSAVGIYEVPAASRALSPIQLGGTYSQPQGITVDASGNVFVAESGSGHLDVKEITASSGHATVSTAFTLSSIPFGLAVDASENIFVAADSGDVICEYMASSGYTTFSTLPFGFGLIENLNLDASGDLYADDAMNSVVYEIPAALHILATGLEPRTIRLRPERNHDCVRCSP